MRLRSGRLINKSVFSEREIKVAETLCMMKNRKINPNHYEPYKTQHRACDYIKSMVEKSIKTCMNVKLFIN